MRRILLLVVLLGFSMQINAQNNGVAGKRGVIKSNIVDYVSSRGFNLSFEYAISKHLSLDFEYRLNIKKMKPVYPYFNLEPILDGEKFKVKSNIYSTTLRFYEDNQFNAPKGKFYYLKAGYGTAVVDGYSSREVEDDFGRTSTEYFKFRETGIHFIPIELGLGKQWVFGKYLAFEVSAGYNVTWNINEDVVYNSSGLQLAGGIANRLSPSLIPTSQYLVQDNLSRLSHGLVLSIRFGFMTPF